MNEQNTVFRKKTLERISSPEQLTEYLKVTNPGMWVILSIVIVLLLSLAAWSSVGTLETTAAVKVVVEDHRATVISLEGTELSAGMPLRVSENVSTIASADEDDYGRSVGLSEIDLPDGTYDGVVVTERIRPMDFLLKSS